MSDKLPIAYLSLDLMDSFPFKALVEQGLLPTNCRRFILDSGPPDGVAKIYFDCYAYPAQADAIMDRLLHSKPIRKSRRRK